VAMTLIFVNDPNNWEAAGVRVYSVK